MKRNIFLIVVLICIGLSSCTKIEVVPTQLKMQVINEQGYSVSGANVYLYANQTDFYKDKNVVASGLTDANGFVYFTNLSPQYNYYFYVQDGCLDNFNNIIHVPYSLEPNAVNSIQPVLISSVGSIKVQNNSIFPFKILVDSEVYLDNLPAMSNTTFYEIPAGTHTVEVIQLSGYVGLPIDEIFNNVTVKCGATTVISFP